MTQVQKPSVRNLIILLGTVLVIGNLGDNLHKSSRVYLFQQAQCLVHYKSVDPTKIQSDFHIDEGYCKVKPIQSRLATIDGIDSSLGFLPPLLLLGTFKELLPRTGLRRLVLLSLICAGLEVLYSISVFWLHQDWGTVAALLSFAFNLIGGGVLVRITIVSKCIADISPPEELTNSYNYISGFYFLASVAGSGISSLLLSQHVYLLNIISIACYALAACFAVAIPSHCGREEQNENYAPILQEHEEDDLGDSQLSLDESAVLSIKPKRDDSTLRILLRSWRTSYESISTLFSTSFPTSTIIIIYLLNGLAAKVEVLFPQYISLLLSWPFATVNGLMALKHLVAALFLLMLPTVRRLYLEPRMSVQHIDLFITQVSLVANTIGIIAMGISAPPWFFMVALCVYTSGQGLEDSLVSYGKLTLPPGEAASEFYTRTGLITTISSLVAAPVWSALFSVVLRGGVLPLGLPFWSSAALFGVGLAGVTVLKRSAR